MLSREIAALAAADAADDDDQPVLVARRADGEQVQVASLSEGTRDQLFFALRLALLERWTSEPMPFIGDGLLTSFDEERTLGMLRLPAAAGQERQIILFTHTGMSLISPEPCMSTGSILSICEIEWRTTILDAIDNV